MVVAKRHMKFDLSLFAGLMTVKYIYGPATVNAANDDVIGSSISGRIETNIILGRMTTIAMPMKGEPKTISLSLTLNLTLTTTLTLTPKSNL